MKRIVAHLAIMINNSGISANITKIIFVVVSYIWGTGQKGLGQQVELDNSLAPDPAVINVGLNTGSYSKYVNKLS